MNAKRLAVQLEKILLRYCRRLHQEHESFAGSFAFELIKRHKANGIINTIVVV
jgi:hypothetical protein